MRVAYEARAASQSDCVPPARPREGDAEVGCRTVNLLVLAYYHAAGYGPPYRGRGSSAMAASMRSRSAANPATLPSSSYEPF